MVFFISLSPSMEHSPGDSVTQRASSLWEESFIHISSALNRPPLANHPLLSRCRAACPLTHTQMPFQFTYSSLRVEVLWGSDPRIPDCELREREKARNLETLNFRQALTVCMAPSGVWTGFSYCLHKAVQSNFFPPTEGAKQGK